MSSFLERMQAERDELKTKHIALRKFFSTPIYRGLPDRKRTLMRSQADAMKAYLHILELRIQLEENEQ